MSRAHSTLEAFGLAVAIASSALYIGCGGGSGDVTGPPGGGGAGTVDSLVLSVDSADVIVGDTIRITAEARDANGQVVPGIRLGFSTSDPAVATVTDDGLVTAVDFGEAEIGVEIAGEASLGSASLTPSYSAVMASNRSRFRMRGVPRIVITPGEQTLDQGVTAQYSASVTNVRGQGFPNVQIRWSSSQPSVASVDAAGLATTQNEGDTDIRVTVTAGNGVSRPLQITARVPLHVAVCGGVFNVVSWFGSTDVEYIANGFAAGAQARYRVHHISTGAGDLSKVQGQTGSDSMVWQGPVSGDVSLDNSVSFPVPPPVNTGVTTEAKSGSIEPNPAAFARLTVKRPVEGSRTCTYNLQYGDWFSWDITNNQGAPARPMSGPVGVARLIGKELAPRSQNGQWVLGGTASTDFDVLPARAFANLESKSDYTVGSTLGVSMIIALGGSSGVYGQATLQHVFTGRLP